jgi:hypothetical protein
MGGLAADDRLVARPQGAIHSMRVTTTKRSIHAPANVVGSCWFPAKGKLDYGNAPRATPLLLEDRVILLGAFGQLLSVAHR